MSLLEILDEYATPLYLYDKRIIIEKYNSLRTALGNKAKLFYSMKANPLMGICKLMYQMGSGIEAASKGEIVTALRAGVPAAEIIFTSPGKTYEELDYAIKKGIKLINVDSYEEVKTIDEIAKKQGVKVNISIRINPSENSNNARIKMAGVSSQFGVEESEINECLSLCKKLTNINICGFQVYMGTQMLKAEDIENNTDYALDLFIKLSERHAIDLKTVNVGGGFGVKYFDNEQELDMKDLEKRLRTVIEKYENKLADTEIIFESGRYLMAEAGRFITRVLYVKNSKGKKYVICDGGSNFHSAAAFLGRFVRNNFPVTTLTNDTEKEQVNVTGPLCTPLDLIGQNINIDKHIKKGDFIIIEKSEMKMCLF